MSGEGKSFSHATYHVGAEWLVRCNTYDDTTPILSFDAGSSAVSITTKGTDANLAAVEFAKALASAAQKFADEMERMHAAQLDGAEGTTRPLVAMRPEHAPGGAAGVRSSGRPGFSPDLWNLERP